MGPTDNLLREVHNEASRTVWSMASRQLEPCLTAGRTELKLGS